MKKKIIGIVALFIMPVSALADTATYAVDNDGALIAQDTVWMTAQTQGSGEGTENNTSTDFQVSVQQHLGTNSYIISRGFIDVYFDLPAGAIVDSAIYEIYVNSKSDGDNDARAFIALYDGTQASTGGLINDDYDQCGSTAYSDSLDITSITTGAYNTIDLNATGIAALDLNGWNKFCIREGHDAQDVAPDNNTFNQTLNAAIDSGSPSTYSKFTITYHIASSSSSSSSSSSAFSGSLILTHTACNDYVTNGSGDAIFCNQWDTSLETNFVAMIRTEIGAGLYSTLILMLRYIFFGCLAFFSSRWLFRTVTQWRPVHSILGLFRRRR